MKNSSVPEAEAGANLAVACPGREHMTKDNYRAPTLATVPSSIPAICLFSEFGHFYFC